MLSHVFLGVSDFERAMSFYQPLMAALGNELRFQDESRPWAGGLAADAVRAASVVSDRLPL